MSDASLASPVQCLLLRFCVSELNVVNQLRNGSLVCAWNSTGSDRRLFSHYKWRSGQDGRAAGLNKNRRSQAEMAALSQERDADVGWREK